MVDAFTSPTFYRFLVTNAPLDAAFVTSVVDSTMPRLRSQSSAHSAGSVEALGRLARSFECRRQLLVWVTDPSSLPATTVVAVPNSPRSTMKFGQKALVSGALVGAAITGGAVAASVLGTASAQTSSTSTAAASTDTSSTDSSTAPPANQGPHSANGITEAPLTGDDLTKATAAAQAALPGATIDRAETDAEGAAYEVHVTKADGSHATVKLDASFNVTSAEDGMA